MQIRDPGRKKLGSGINIPDPQHWRITQLYKKHIIKNHLKISIIVDHVGLQLLQHVLYQKASRFHKNGTLRYKLSKQIKTLPLLQEKKINSKNIEKFQMLKRENKF